MYFVVVLLVLMFLIPTHEFPTFLCCSFVKCEIQEKEQIHCTACVLEHIMVIMLIIVFISKYI